MNPCCTFLGVCGLAALPSPSATVTTPTQHRPRLRPLPHHTCLESRDLGPNTSTHLPILPNEFRNRICCSPSTTLPLPRYLHPNPTKPSNHTRANGKNQAEKYTISTVLRSRCNSHTLMAWSWSWFWFFFFFFFFLHIAMSLLTPLFIPSTPAQPHGVRSVS